MSIQSQIDRINENVAATYNVLNEAGAPMPASMDTNNLAETAAGISAVLYNKEQNLTNAEKERARENIAALGTNQLDAAIDTALAEAKASGDFKGDKGDTGEVDYSRLNDYLPLAGGTMTGGLAFSSDASIKTNSIIFRFGSSSDANYAAVLARNGSSNFFRPGANNIMDLGTSAMKWKSLYLSGNLSDGTNSINVANIASKSDIEAAIGNINTETWTFTLEDGSTVTKKVLIG